MADAYYTKDGALAHATAQLVVYRRQEKLLRKVRDCEGLKALNGKQVNVKIERAVKAVCEKGEYASLRPSLYDEGQVTLNLTVDHDVQFEEPFREYSWAYAKYYDQRIYLKKGKFDFEAFQAEIDRLLGFIVGYYPPLQYTIDHYDELQGESDRLKAEIEAFKEKVGFYMYGAFDITRRWQ